MCSMTQMGSDHGSRSARYGLLVIHFDFEAQVFNHAPHFGRWGTGGGQVAVDEDGVSRVQSQRLERSQVMFSSPGDAYFGARVHKAEQAQHFETALRCERVAM